MENREQDQQISRDQAGGKRPGIAFIVFLLAVMAGTVWVSSASSIEEMRKPPLTMEEYKQKVKQQQDELKKITEQTKAGMKETAAILVKDARQAIIVKDFDKAFRLTDEVIKIDPENSGAYLVRGIAWYTSGKPAEAQSDLSVAIKLNPRSAEAFLYRGLVQMRQKKLDEGLADLNEAIKINPRYGAAYYYRAAYWEQTGKKDQAQVDYKKACELGVKQACDKVNQ